MVLQIVTQSVIVLGPPFSSDPLIQWVVEANGRKQASFLDHAYSP